jgi:dihydropteroate synthase
VNVRPHFDIPLANGRLLELGRRPLVMGILNLTPDSFADSRLAGPREAIDRALAIEAEGADIIDIGGESTRPGADAVDAQTELDRIMPVVEGLRGRLTIPMSVDTYKAVVADAALAAGAHIVNDISGLKYDPPLAGVVARRGASIVLMHTRGRSKDMYAEAEYSDVVREVTGELRASIGAAVGAGIPRTAIVVDPGIGFAKRSVHSYGVLARLPEIGEALGLPVLVGPSRKLFLKSAPAAGDPRERDWATAAAVTAAVLGGAHIVRVHAVAPMVQVVRAAEEIYQATCQTR